MELPQRRTAVSAGSELEQFIIALPKAELHLHLEGAVDLPTLNELAVRHGMPEVGQDLYCYTDFGGFLKAFKCVCDHLCTPADYEIITYRLLIRLHAAGVVYTEIYIAAGVLLWQGKALEELLEGANAGYRRARAECGIEAAWIFDATRQFGAEAAMEMARRAAALRDRGVIGIGIGGDENRGAPELFRDVYQFARSRGLRLTAHAGEVAGPASIWGALHELRVERIGHGVAAAQDPELVRWLAGHRVPVDICLTSNLRTGAVEALEQHPLRRFFDAGMLVSLSTDDPTMFGTDIVRAYLLAHESLRFSRDELRQLAEYSLRASFRDAAAPA